MVEPGKKKGGSMEHWRGLENSATLRSRQKVKRQQKRPSGRGSATSVTSEMTNDEVLTTTPSMDTLTGPSPPKVKKIITLEFSRNKMPVEDEPEIDISRSSISLKTIKTPSRTSLVSARFSGMQRPSEIERANSFQDLRRPMSHQRMSDIQIIEKAHNVGSKNETRTEPKTGKSAEKSSKRNVVSWKSENNPESSSAKPTLNNSNNRANLQSAPQKPDNVKTSIILEYSNIIETIKQQNNNLEKIKRDMLSITVPNVRKSLEKRYFAEENKLNDELVRAMVLQSRYPYERWPEIPVAPNIYDDYNSVHPQIFVKKARQHISCIEQPERKCAGEDRQCVESSSDESNQCSDDPNILLKDLLDKVDKENSSEISCTTQPESLNTVITHLLRKRKRHMRHCHQCEVEPKNCRVLERIDQKLSRECKMKLKQLMKMDGAQECCGCDGSKSSQGNSCQTSSSDDDQSSSKQDFDSLEDEQMSAILKLTKMGKPEKQQDCSPCCKTRKEELEIGSKKKVKSVCNRENDKLLSVLEKMASELKQISCAQSSYCNAADTRGIQNVQTHACAEPLPLSPCTRPTIAPCANENANGNAQPTNAHPCERNTRSISHRSSAGACGNTNSDMCTSTRTHSENDMCAAKQRLKDKLREVKAEKDELRFIMREQESQMIDYRNRYLQAKQEIEEQLHHICELEKCNECIEDRINNEMKQIQSKFEQNLKHVQICLETESKKLKQACREKEEIREKLNICCCELHKARKNAASSQKKSEELQAFKEKYKQLERCNNELREEIKCLKLELATLRRDTSAILCRSKENAQRQNCEFNKRIHELEDELAKERAHSSCAIKEKDRCCKLLENARCESETAKAQVKTLQAYAKTLSCQIELLKSKPCKSNIIC